MLQSAIRQKQVETEKQARHGLDSAMARLGWHALLTREDDTEQRAEALWRMRQWGHLEGLDGFHSSIHSAA